MALRLGECLLRRIRENRGLTQVGLSEALYDKFGISISDSILSKYERGKKYPNPLVSRAICLTLGCNESDLYEFLE
ncbi:helix-turn-helix domain-containing protein [Paenibacillus rhizophilus]|uniref:XRE family transcriptional regulator n=1 Tax=Paenibacillus rhizophilus TaxID=1850366 RepID=A0A3N9P6P7_9BACL|nr:XRE family transcriptional regulator [Paenibacillus rhizophilus]